MNPPGVQLSTPIVPPVRQTRTSSSAPAWWCGANITPRQDSTTSNDPDAAPRARDWWLLIKPDDVDVCDDDPGQPVTVTITAGLRTMVRIWRGDLSWSAALGAEQVRIEGPQRRAVPSWFALSQFAAVPRP